MFETGDAVKSCPAVDPVTGLVIVGSHDGHVYALNPKVRTFNTKRCKLRKLIDLYIAVVSYSVLPK